MVPTLCAKCKTNPSTLISRGHPSCESCFLKHLTSKPNKSLSLLSRSLPPTASPRSYTLALSLGPSSLALLHFLHANLHFQLTRNRSPPFNLTVLHIGDADLSPYRERFPDFTFINIPLSKVLYLGTIKWELMPYGKGLPLADSTPGEEAAKRLGDLFAELPSAAARGDLHGLFIRHVLVDYVSRSKQDALLLGHSTTALAELTLSETVKGRGFSVPRTVGDGRSEEEEGIVVWRPVRDCLRKELVSYVGMVGLAELVREVGIEEGRVVSHKDLSIEEVMVRYFREVEENYPSVVANVARTTGKLVGIKGEGGTCGVCRGPLDERGDERWRGELGVDGGIQGVCYGCERSSRG